MEQLALSGAVSPRCGLDAPHTGPRVPGASTDGGATSCDGSPSPVDAARVPRGRAPTHGGDALHPETGYDMNASLHETRFLRD
jgi:hypothetical protein